ncbi:MAG: Fe-S cluster assembly protein HesB [Actinobacteria bacterium]|nr:Fe-S cluster assembly protein HesB [Actinomycetota bacterium]MDP6177749.1 HhH-GPD-type base excision DNA repair protein [Acidimicrobiales bacterium]HJM27160.1 HhH-GPD-type base excision DNA repair protein [Acidimicrobiales bacterium]
MPGTLAVTGDVDADALINSDPLALLIGMLLDQQVPMEWAFRGPATLLERLGSLDAVAIAEMEPDLLDIECRTKPAVHRYPSSMAKRIQALCQHIVDNYDGDASLLWGSATSGADLKQRLVSLPGYGDEKAMIFTAILAKRMGVAPAGWQDAAGPFSDNTPRSVADIDGPEALATVREWKKAQKAVGKSKQQ